MFRGEKIVIPTTLRPYMLKLIHQAHLGIVKCKHLAKDVIFWPGLSKQIEDIVSSVIHVKLGEKKEQKEPLRPTTVPERPWSKVAADLFEID